jgi:hypothetical protein
MKPAKLLAIGGSAGSLQVILTVLGAIGDGFPMPVLVVLHRNAGFESTLEDLFSARTGLSIKEVEEKDPLLDGSVYLCPADYHVLLEADRSFSLDYSERGEFQPAQYRCHIPVGGGRLWPRPDGAVVIRRQCRRGGGDAVRQSPGWYYCRAGSSHGRSTLHAPASYYVDDPRPNPPDGRDLQVYPGLGLQIT